MTRSIFEMEKYLGIKCFSASFYANLAIPTFTMGNNNCSNRVEISSLLERNLAELDGRPEIVIVGSVMWGIQQPETSLVCQERDKGVWGWV